VFQKLNPTEATGYLLNTMSLALQKGLPAARIFDQWLLEVLLGAPADGPVRKGAYLALRAVRQLRLALSDPLVTFPLGPCRLCLPLSHELPFYKKRFPGYALNLGRVSFHVSQKYPDLTMIDVGANVGDSAAVVRMFNTHPILCVEGDPGFFRLLAENTRNLPDIELEQTFVGAPGDHIAGIHMQRGNAQVRLGPAPGQASICTLSVALARHPKFANAKLLKLDAEGFDCKIIAAEPEFLKRNKPVLFFEYFPGACETAGHEPFSVFPHLRSLGYITLLIYQNFGEYFMSLSLDQVDSLLDLHHFLVDLQGFCDVVAFHQEDSDVAANIRRSEHAERARKTAERKQITE
jgi:FkbM family methyltransferase